MSTTKHDLVMAIHKATGLKQEDVKRVVQMTLDGIVETLPREGRLEWRGFGVFEVRIRKARKGRNPRTGEAVMVSDRKWVKFRAGTVMQGRIEAGEKR